MRIQTEKLPMYLSAYEDARFFAWGCGGTWKGNLLAFVGQYRGMGRWVLRQLSRPT